MGRVLEFAKVAAGAISGDGLILLNLPEQAVFRSGDVAAVGFFRQGDITGQVHWNAAVG